jgi:hypothetical protein
VRAYDAAQAQAPVMRAAYQSTPSQIEAAMAPLAQREQTGTASAADLATLNTLKTVSSAINAQKGSNPVGLGERAGMFRPTPVDFSQMGQPGFAAALEARNLQAPAVADAYQAATLPFKPEEAAQGKQLFAQMGPAQKAQALASLATHLSKPDVYAAAVKQVAGDDRLSQTAGLLAAQNPDLGRKILEGAALIADKGDESKIGPVRAAITTALPVGLYPNAQTQSDVAHATLAVYAANQAGNHALIDPNDLTGIKAAAAEVTGPQISLNGRVTPIPPDFAPGAISHGLATTNADDLKPFGGLQPGVNPAWLGAHAQLMPLSLGGTRYQVLAAGQRVLNASGGNLVVDLRQLAGVQAARLKQAAKDAAAERAMPQDDPANYVGGGL